MNHFNIQLSLKDIQLKKYIHGLKKLNLNFSFFSVFSDSDKISHLPQFENYISLAGIKALKISQNLNQDNFDSFEEFQQQKEKFKNSFFYTNSLYFDQSYYGLLGLPILNDKSQYMSLKENLYLSFEEDKFIKPSSDLKGFIGGIIPKGTTIENFLKTTTLLPNYLDETILIANVKKIHSEYRFFVINNEVITGSQYKKEDKVETSILIPEEVQTAAENYSKIYTPDQVFVMDLALLNNGIIEIVEYNCFNGSGCYDADMTLVFDILKDIPLNKKNTLKL